MAPAITTSKRKFYRLLDGLTTSPGTNTGSSAQPERPNRRISLLQSKSHPHLRSESVVRPRSPSTTTARQEPPSSPVAPSRSSTDQADRASKRARVADRPSTSGVGASERPGRPSFSFRARMLESAASVRLVSSTAADRRKKLGLDARLTTGEPGESQPVPNYAPWSDDQFLSRLRTFADIKIWPPKPDTVDEVQWAKRGWVCSGVNMVVCQGCSASVLVQLSRPDRKDSSVIADGWVSGFDDALVGKYADLIVTGHDETCLWRSAGCKGDVFRIRMGDVGARNAGIRSRYESLVAIADSLPDSLASPIRLRRIHPGPDGVQPFDLDGFLSCAAGVLFHSSSPTDGGHGSQSVPSTPPPVNKTALALAVFGWSGTKAHSTPMSVCQHCFVRNGMWLYSHKTALLTSPRSQRLQTDSQDQSAGSTRPSVSDKVENESFRFEPDMLHREYCPWRNGESQSAVGQFAGLSGWEILANTVLDQATTRSHIRQALRTNASTAATSPVVGQAGPPESPMSGSAGSVGSTSVAESKERRKAVIKEDQVRLSRFRKLKAALGLDRTRAKEGKEE